MSNQGKLLCGILAAVVLLFFAWMLPTYKKVVKTSDTYKAAWEETQAKSVSIQGVLDTVKHSTNNERVTGYLQEPVFGPDGKAVMRTVKWSASKSSEVTESVKQALAMFQSSTDHSSGTVEHVVTKEVTVTKRGMGEVGIGKADQGLWTGMVGLTLYGALGAWSSALVDVGDKKVVDVEHLGVGLKLQF
jgi:hypothetical protein